MITDQRRCTAFDQSMKCTRDIQIQSTEYKSSVNCNEIQFFIKSTYPLPIGMIVDDMLFDSASFLPELIAGNAIISRNKVTLCIFFVS